MTGALVTATAVIGLLAVLAAREAWCHWYYPQRGRLYLEWRQPELAAAAWECYLRTWTVFGRRRKVAARYSLSHCYWSLGRLDEAAAECERLVANPRSGPLAGLAQRLLADCLGRLNREAPPAPAVPRSAGSDAEARFATELEVRRLETIGDGFAALELLERLAADTLHAHLLDEHVALRLRLAQRRCELGLYAEAQTTAEGLLARGAALATELRHDAHRVSARADLCLESFVRAQRDAESAFRIANLASDTEKLTDDCLLLAELAMHRHDLVEAMRQLQRVRECGARGRWMAGLGEAALLAHHGRRDEAALALDQSARRVPPAVGEGETPAMIVAAAWARFELETDPAQARARLEPHLATPVIHPRLRAQWAALCAGVLGACGDDAAAVPFRREIADARRRFAHDRHLLVELDCAEAWCSPEAAADWLPRALERPPFAMAVPVLQERLARAFAALGRHAEARALDTAVAAFDHPLAARTAARRRLAGEATT